MYFEIIDAEWFETIGTASDVETVSAHYEKLKINPEFYVYLFNLCRKDFKGVISFSWRESRFITGFYDSNELICVIHADCTRIIYFDHVGEFLYRSNFLFGLRFHDYPRLLELADSVYYDQYLMNKFINKRK